VYRKQVRRRRAILVLLVVAALVLLSTQFSEREGGPLHSMQRAVASVFGPMEEGATRALKPARDLINWFDETFNARGENDDLRSELQQLRTQLAQAQSAEGENKQLRELLSLDRQGTLAGYTPVTARVIARSPTVWYATITIDKGSDQGVRVNQPVTTGSGLVGKVSDVAPDASRVTLLTDHTSGVSAQVVPDGANGVVKATVGNPSDLILDFVQKGRPVPKGATVITSGWRSSRLESLFPRGVPIGEVTRVDSDERELYQRVHLRPFADVRDLDFVEVLTRSSAAGEKAELRP
jgi:rod shape-determining protein MreC